MLTRPAEGRSGRGESRRRRRLERDSLLPLLLHLRSWRRPPNDWTQSDTERQTGREAESKTEAARQAAVWRQTDRQTFTGRCLPVILLQAISELLL